MRLRGCANNAPLQRCLATEVDLRIYNYRDFTPLRAGQVDDEPYGGGAGNARARRCRRRGARRPHMSDGTTLG